MANELKNLKKTLLMRTDANSLDEYNINAVHSDEADHALLADKSTLAETAEKTQAAITITKSLTAGPQVETFNGNSAKSINYVPADQGGVFKQPIYLEECDIADDKAVLNQSQVSAKINALTGAPLYTWQTIPYTDDQGVTHYNKVEDVKFTAQIGSDTGYHKVTTIVGTTQDLEALKFLYEQPTSSLDFEHFSDEAQNEALAELPDTFLYICRDIASGGSTINSSNAMYIKIPDDNRIIEISKGASRLNSTENTSANEKYFTFESLTEIIAKINNRLAALGDTKLAVAHPIITEAEIEDTLNPAEVPAVQELQDQITQINGLERVFNDDTEEVSFEEVTPSNITPVLRAKADDQGQNIRTGYYRSTSNNSNTITIATELPTEDTPGNIGDIYIVVKA